MESQDGPVDFIELYLEYMRETEPPYIFHRWCIISGIGALLGRNCYIQLGHFRIFPNLYCMLIGESASRKSTSIKLVEKFISATGYDTFADNKGAKEKFMANLAGISEEDFASIERGRSAKKIATDLDSETIWGDSSTDRTPREVFVCADEFSDFSGTGNAEFLRTLGNLWDWDDETKPFKWGFRTSESLKIWQPTVNILGGNTPETFAKTLPQEIIGDGFLSRLILVSGEKSKRQYHRPPVPSEGDKAELVALLRNIRSTAYGEFSITEEADAALEKIYKSAIAITDIRFKSYNNRRYTQLLKLCIIFSAARFTTEVSYAIVIAANTTLSAAEALMPRALGEFGKSRQSDTTNKVMDVISRASKPVSVKDIYKQVHNDLNKTDDLANMLNSLILADRIQLIPNKGYLPKMAVSEDRKFVDFSLLTDEEQEMT